MTYRGCQLDGGKTDPCQIAYGKAKLQRGVKIESCSICKDDACNGATRLAMGPTVWLLIGGSSLLALIGFTSRRQFL